MYANLPTDDVILVVLNQILIKNDEERYFGQFVSEMFDSLQWDSTKCTLQYKLDSFVTMATY